MSADVLRRAAALMRERAGAATQAARWQALGPDVRAVRSAGDRDSIQEGVAYRVGRAPDATHIASWHPAVALAVADWLSSAESMGECAGEPIWDAALAVARAYLGEADA